MRAGEVPVAIGLGSNLGSRRWALRRAVIELRRLITVQGVSPVFETIPEMGLDQPKFLNACCVGTTALAPLSLLEGLHRIESDLGRCRESAPHGYLPRTLDLDLLLYGEHVIDDANLVVPHPRMRTRGFVLIPLETVAGDWRVPASRGWPDATVAELKRNVPTEGVKLTSQMLDIP